MLIWLLNTTQYCTRICNKASLKKRTIGIYEHCLDRYTEAPNSLTRNEYKARTYELFNKYNDRFCENINIKY
jgi:flagellin-specific chaperone FliS